MSRPRPTVRDLRVLALRRGRDLLVLALLGLALAAPSPISVFPAPAGSPWTTIVKQVDETVTSSTTMQDDDALTFALAANTTYLFRAVIFFNTPAAADYKYRHVCTGTQAAGTFGFSLLIFFDNSISDDNGSVCDTTLNVIVPLATAAGGSFRMTGLIQQTGTAGTWTWSWAQGTANAGATITRAGSYIEWMTVP